MVRKGGGGELGEAAVCYRPNQITIDICTVGNEGNGRGIVKSFKDSLKDQDGLH